MSPGYVDLYMLPVPEANLVAYQRQATEFARLVLEHGGLSYREFRGDDAGEGMAAGENEAMMVAIAEFQSRDHRDEVMGKVMADARVAVMIAGEQPADMTRMRYGGYAVFVDASSAEGSSSL